MDHKKALVALHQNISQVVFGKSDAVTLALICLIAEGHLLIEDMPGLGKTVLARALAQSISGQFRRLQCTPDLLPGDVTGVSIFNQLSRQFEFTPGPVFCNILLADEINRAPPRAQSSLLEAMAEYQVTVDGVSHVLPEVFMVIATQNPVELHGTYPLPEAQLDRFLMRVRMGYPDTAAEMKMLRSQQESHPLARLQPVMNVADIRAIQQRVRTIAVADKVAEYAIGLAQESRRHPALVAGVSPRGVLALIRAAQALAFIKGQEYVTPQMVKYLAPHVLAHRVITRDGGQGEGTGEKAIHDVRSRVAVPV